MKVSTCAIGASQAMAAVMWTARPREFTWKVDVSHAALEAEDPEMP
jgi:hypothetical protein